MIRKNIQNILEQKFYRGVGNNWSDVENTAFTWVTTDRKVAMNYASDEKNILEFDIDKPKKTFVFPFKNGNTSVRASNITDILYQLIYDYVDSNGHNRTIDIAIDILETYEDIAGENLEPYHTKISKPIASNYLKEFLQFFGYDSIGIAEGSRTVNTYAIFK